MAKGIVRCSLCRLYYHEDDMSNPRCPGCFGLGWGDLGGVLERMTDDLGVWYSADCAVTEAFLQLYKPKLKYMQAMANACDGFSRVSHWRHNEVWMRRVFMGVKSEYRPRPVAGPAVLGYRSKYIRYRLAQLERSRTLTLYFGHEGE